MRTILVPLLLIAAAADIAAFSLQSLTISHAPRHRIRAVSQQRKALKLTCQAEAPAAAGSPVLDVESTEAEPFLAFPGVSDKVLQLLWLCQLFRLVTNA